ncbi:hypothetical protein SAMN05444280_11778 [Tangfeifania diversioriginum]|uniref:T9SS C-terminal target domain-containing protein n=1 Tax=Tangfeifania diversioriginum TaxID=1168035 RepID=A0A1M6IPS8_9BACT|nr:hypothetical protein [Tangfeifania diversioriginum]SHJ36461.1 hypothetical protein SAMN05444280_11778 [Tangfeifania diversioriginum]
MRRIVVAIFVLITVFPGCRKSDFLLEEKTESFRDDGSGTGTVTWTKNNEYILEGLVFVNDGQVLTIEPGTVVRFRSGQAENASALIVARGGKIIAEGTQEEPIIFTSENDDLQGSVAKDERGLWGGLIILGNAPLNVSGGEARVEGIPYFEQRGIFGGGDEDDNSGVLRYVSIRHGGTNIGEGNEINGLTLGGVGNKTEIDFVEVISNEDDGVEIFGGTVNLKHMVVAGCGDDAFDYDLGWSGNGQFWLGIENDFVGDNLIEAGGGTNPVIGFPHSLPTIYNATLIGNGLTGNGSLAVFERFAGGVIANSVMMNDANGILLEVTDGANDSFSQWKNGKLDIRNNLFFDVGSAENSSPFKLSGVYSSEMENEWAAYFSAAQNETGNPGIDPESGYFVPEQKITGSLSEYPESWFQRVDFKGAFGEDNWIEGWTLLAE